MPALLPRIWDYSDYLCIWLGRYAELCDWVHDAKVGSQSQEGLVLNNNIDSDSDSDPGHYMDADESEDVNIGLAPSAQAPPAAVRPIKPLPRRRPGQKPEIVVLSESNHRSP